MSNNDFIWNSEVRDYELDSQGIVNNATYINYLEQARSEYVRSLGVDFDEYYKAGYIFVVAGIDIEYRAPLRMQCQFCVSAKIVHYGDKRIQVAQEIRSRPDNKLVAKATVRVACVDYKTGKSSIPVQLEKLLKDVQ